MAAQTTPSSAPPTWLGYPEPADTASIPRVGAKDLVEAMRQIKGGSAGRAGIALTHNKIQLIDVRRADLTGAMLAGSLNFPAHTFYPSRHAIASTLAASGTDVCVVYCASSRGRGPRVAGWLRDAVAEKGQQGKDGQATTMQVVVLEGGAKGFVETFGEDESLVVRLPEEVHE